MKPCSAGLTDEALKIRRILLSAQAISATSRKVLVLLVVGALITYAEQI